MATRPWSATPLSPARAPSPCDPCTRCRSGACTPGCWSPATGRGPGPPRPRPWPTWTGCSPGHGEGERAGQIGTDSVDPDLAEGCGGPADVTGDWSLYFNQTLDGLDPNPTLTAPIAASEHFIHR